MNPPTPTEPRSRSPVNTKEPSKAVPQTNTVSDLDSLVDPKLDLEMAQFSKDIAEQLDNVLCINDGETSSMHSSSGSQKQDDAGQAEVMKAECGHTLMQELSKMDVETNIDSPTPSSSTICPADGMVLFSSGVDKKDVNVASVDDIESSPMDSAKDIIKAGAAIESSKQEPTSSPGFGNVTEDQNISKTKNHGETVSAEDTSNTVGGNDGKKPANPQRIKNPKGLTIGGDSKASVEKECESESLSQRLVPMGLFRLPNGAYSTVHYLAILTSIHDANNEHHLDYMSFNSETSWTPEMNVCSKWSSFGSTQRSYSPDAETSPDEDSNGEPLRRRIESEASITSMTKPLERPSDLVSKDKEDGEDGSRCKLLSARNERGQARHIAN